MTRGSSAGTLSSTTAAAAIAVIKSGEAGKVIFEIA